LVRAQVPDRGDIYHVNLDPAAGREQRGYHDAVILTTREYNLAHLPFAAPVTTIGNASCFGGAYVSLAGSGTSVTGIVQLDQVRAFDPRARNATTTRERVPDAIMIDILARFVAIFE
jgi:mRNA-degrading endonuclease toxin of MazEF toxin-antitoxin module